DREGVPLERYGPALFEPPERPLIDDTPLLDNFLIKYKFLCRSRVRLLGKEDLSSNSHQVDSSSPDSEEAPRALHPSQKGKWRVKSLLKEDITKFVEFVKRPKSLRKS
ncbi:uncharacterized protein BT62DRAFT_1074683, partial [Guyanagaster necrorhizus]